MRLRLLSRGSDLAVLQAQMVARALRQARPDLDVVSITRSSEGDRDRRVALWAAADKGLFTADLSAALANGDADVVVHSWKDLPIASHPGTEVVGTLERADPRDVLLVRRPVLDARPAVLNILSSSPRRTWQLETSLPGLLPWPIESVKTTAVRGNIPTRLKKLVAGEGDALVVAKAALDRLLSRDAPAAVTAVLRGALASCRWMVLPLREFPTAPAQGALAIEAAANRADVRECVQAVSHAATWQAVQRERAILQAFGGGCHEAVGATVLVRDYGAVTSVRARLAGQADEVTWSLETTSPAPARVPAGAIWPRPEERDAARRTPLGVTPPTDAAGLWIARADAVPDGWRPDENQLVWVSGSRTWRKLTARGIWVHGSADGLGDAEAPNVDTLADHGVTWMRITHAASGDSDAVATYAVDVDLPEDLAGRRHFFWTSGSLFLRALDRHPSIRDKWHASGPGRTARVIRDTLGPDARPTVWLDYEQWLRAVVK